MDPFTELTGQFLLNPMQYKTPNRLVSQESDSFRSKAASEVGDRVQGSTPTGLRRIVLHPTHPHPPNANVRS